jgi:hypothetical protein
MGTKIGAGISAVLATLLLIFHLLHVFHSVSEFGEKDKNDVLKNAPAYIIQTDPAGKKDTMMMEDYLKKENR